MITILAGGAMGAAALHHGALWVLQRRLIFPGAYMMGSGEEPGRPDVERLSVTHAAGQTHGYLLPAGAAEDGAQRGLVVYAHGNAECAADWIFDAQPYTAAGFHFLCLEYRGFGGSDGTPSERGIVEDSILLIDQVLARGDLAVDPARIVYHGRSVGGGAISAVARKRPPARLILEATFSSVHSMSSGFWAPRYLVRDPLDVRLLLAESFGGPVLLLHSRIDEVIPFAEFGVNQAAAQAAQSANPARGLALETVIHERMGHNDSWLFEDPERLLRFALAR
ncbi:MAG: pimeloyl-ACP methyl ester carboxylesterase [Planctomycetota bacterium]|jgi:pimeloyl-ACP methyl ester carboxylesterase